jgi:hypothetical protein
MKKLRQYACGLVKRFAIHQYNISLSALPVFAATRRAISYLVLRPPMNLVREKEKSLDGKKKPRYAPECTK